ncbi:MAG: MFS transporter [Chitinophagaceae bacterium]
MMNQSKTYALPIIIMFALFAMISFVTGLSNPFGIIVKNQFGASNFMSQLGTFANFLAYAFMGIPAGLLLKRIGYKKTALIAIVVGFFGVGIMYLSGAMESFGIYLSGAFVAGFSMCMLNTVVNPMLNTLGGGGKKGNQLIQFGGSINSLSATIVPVFLGYLIGNIVHASIDKANPALFIAMGIFALAFLVLSIVKIPELHKEEKQLAQVKDKYSPLSFRHFFLGAIAIFIYVGVEVGIPNFLNLFLTDPIEKGGLAMDTTMVGAVVGTYWFLMMIGRIFGGIIASKIAPKVMLSVVAGLGAILVLIAIFIPTTIMVNMPVFESNISFVFAKVPLSVLLFVLCGLSTSVMWGGIFNLAVEGLGVKYTAMASGIFMVMVCGGGILPLVQGQVADMTNFINSYWVIFAGCLYILYYALIGSTNVNKNIPVN